MGWGVIESTHNTCRYIDSKLIQTSASDQHINRIEQIMQALTIPLANYNPQLICIERVFISINPKSSLLLGEARGAALATLLSAKVPILEITALQIKQSIVGKGRASKEQVAIMVKRLLSLPADLKLETDRSDALACALAGKSQSQFDNYLSTIPNKRRRGIPTLRQLAKSKS